MLTHRACRTFVLAVLAGVLALLCGCIRQPPEPPPPPAGLLVAQGVSPTYIRVVWEGMAGDVSYELQRSLYPDEGFLPLANTTAPIYEDRDAGEGILYWYRVRACNAAGCGAFAEPSSGYLQGANTGAPWVPDGLTASEGTYRDKVRLTWFGVPRADTYRIYRSPGAGKPFEHLATAEVNVYDDLHGPDDALVACRSYRYTVMACNRHGCSDPSVVVIGQRSTPMTGVPGGLQASRREFPDRISLTWNEVPGAVAYRVYRGPEEMLLGTSDRALYEDIHHPEDNPLEAGIAYAYRVQALGEGECGEGSLSSQVEGSASEFPGEPLELATSSRIGEVTVRWQPGPSIVPPTHYEVLRSRERDGPYTVIGDAIHPDTTFIDENVSPGTYWYRVRAANEYGWAETEEGVPAQVP